MLKSSPATTAHTCLRLPGDQPPDLDLSCPGCRDALIGRLALQCLTLESVLSFHSAEARGGAPQSGPRRGVLHVDGLGETALDVDVCAEETDIVADPVVERRIERSQGTEPGHPPVIEVIVEELSTGTGRAEPHLVAGRAVIGCRPPVAFTWRSAKRNGGRRRA